MSSWARILCMLSLAALLSAKPAAPPVPEGATLHPALAALAAKAPGQPPYGLHITSPEGQFIFTNLRYNAAAPHGRAVLYRVTGPAGMGPYRLGVQLGFRPQLIGNVNGQRTYKNVFYLIDKAMDGGAAKDAGLDEAWAILAVDGKDFGWNLNALISYLTTRPSVEVLARKQKGWGEGKKKTFRIQLRKQESPADPTDGVLVPETVESFRTLLTSADTFSELARLRSATSRFTPLSLKAGDQVFWVIRGVPDPHPDTGQDGSRIFLEFWKEDPTQGPKQIHPDVLWAEPTDHLLQGRSLRLADRWMRITEAAFDPDSGRLPKLALDPWKADVAALLRGSNLSRDLGPGGSLQDREALEQLANEALVEWKTRALPGLLGSQTLEESEERVVQIEKGVLVLDLEGKATRSRLDAAVRAEAERKAQAELAAKEGRPAPEALPPAAESERLADLLDQRKAILMAILSSAKQALAQLRR